jgi:quercetin dioxygenase-like cupin family protein
MSLDPVETNPDHYHVVFENDRVRVLEYTDTPGARTQPHEHPDSVMVTLSSFRRRLYHGGEQRDVEITAGRAHWLPAQQHAGENIGDTDTHSFFVELKEGRSYDVASSALGPQ